MLNKQNVSTLELKKFIEGELVTNYLLHPLNNCNHIHFGTDFKNVVIRIFEGKMRVRDYSLNNLKLVLLDEDYLEFQIVHKGLENNFIRFNNTSTLSYDYEREMLLVHVNGFVYYKDNSRRYDYFIPYDLNIHNYQVNNKVKYQKRIQKKKYKRNHSTKTKK